MLARRTQVVLSLIAFTCAVVDAQNITGAIVGQVADPSGSAVPGAAISAMNMDTGLTAQTTTDTSGSRSRDGVGSKPLAVPMPQSWGFCPAQVVNLPKWPDLGWRTDGAPTPR